MLVKIGVNHINPAQVIRVASFEDEDGYEQTIVYLSDGTKLMIDDGEARVVALINANL